MSDVIVTTNIVRSANTCVRFGGGPNSNIMVTNNILIGGNSPVGGGSVSLSEVSGNCTVSNNVMENTKGPISVSQSGTSGGNFAFMNNHCITSGNPFSGVEVTLATTTTNNFYISNNVIDGGPSDPSFTFVNTGAGGVRQNLTCTDNTFGGTPLTVANTGPDSLCMNMRNVTSSVFELHNLGAGTFTILAPSQAGFEASNFGGPYVYAPGVGSFTFSTTCP